MYRKNPDGAERKTVPSTLEFRPWKKRVTPSYKRQWHLMVKSLNLALIRIFSGVTQKGDEGIIHHQIFFLLQ